MLYPLEQPVLSVRHKAIHFLSGLTSNDLDKPQNAFLNQHGRIIAVCFQQQTGEDEFLLSVPVGALKELLVHLERYAKLNQTQLEIAAQTRSYLNIDTGAVVFSKENILAQISKEAFTLYRLEHNLPLMEEDFQAGEFILNVDDGRYVSFTKGCFLGQEPVSKVHHRAKATRKLVVKFEDECSIQEKDAMTSRTIDPKTGKTKGFVFISNI